jgi:hypothetical protein
MTCMTVRSWVLTPSSRRRRCHRAGNHAASRPSLLRPGVPCDSARLAGTTASTARPIEPPRQQPVVRRARGGLRASLALNVSTLTQSLRRSHFATAACETPAAATISRRGRVSLTDTGDLAQLRLCTLLVAVSSEVPLAGDVRPAELQARHGEARRRLAQERQQLSGAAFCRENRFAA